MECLWGMYGHRQPDGYCYQQDPAILPLHFPADHGLAHHHLHGPGLLEKYAQVYLGSQTKSLVLFVIPLALVQICTENVTRPGVPSKKSYALWGQISSFNFSMT